MLYIITRQPMPNGMAGTNRIKCYVRALKNAGVPCEILVFSRDSLSDYSQGDIGGVQYRYICGFKKRWVGQLGSIQTVIMRIGLYFFLLTHLKKNDIVLEYARETYMYINRIIKLTHFKNAKFVSELCEVPGLGYTNKESLNEREYITQYLFPQYDGVIAISDILVEYAKKYVSKQCNYLKIPVLVDADEFQQGDVRPVSEPYVFYSGSFNDQKDGTIGMFEAFRQVSKEYKGPLKFVCTGTRTDALNTNYLNEIINDSDLANRLVFTGYMSHDKIINYLYHCSLVVSARYTNEQTVNGFSTKLAEYAASGKALILTPVGEAATWFHDGIDCMMIPEKNSNALAAAIIRLLEDNEKSACLGNNIRQTCLNSFDYRVWSNSFLGFVETLSKS